MPNCFTFWITLLIVKETMPLTPSTAVKIEHQVVCSFCQHSCWSDLLALVLTEHTALDRKTKLKGTAAFCFPRKILDRVQTPSWGGGWRSVLLRQGGTEIGTRRNYLRKKGMGREECLHSLHKGMWYTNSICFTVPTILYTVLSVMKGNSEYERGEWLC